MTFDARKHTGRVLTKIGEKHGEGWEVDSIDPRAGTLTASRFAQITEVSATESADTMLLGLARGTRPSDGEKIAAKFEDTHPGYKLTKFDPYLGQATMTKLSNPVIRARDEPPRVWWRVAILGGSDSCQRSDTRLNSKSVQYGWYLIARRITTRDMRLSRPWRRNWISDRKAFVCG
ncbi:hypothetical protein ACO0LV_18480 [Pseudactinotalea sp. Z1739]|uniref:hypothetical protein n=1 Tax=Pseudactinotalea sp. Z1739 TaxID=3413028 RepID=UPI003C7A2B6A